MDPSNKRHGGPAAASFPAVHLLHLCEVLRRWDVPSRALLEPLSLDD